jgi:hypothetical protein
MDVSDTTPAQELTLLQWTLEHLVRYRQSWRGEDWRRYAELATREQELLAAHW